MSSEYVQVRKNSIGVTYFSLFIFFRLVGSYRTWLQLWNVWTWRVVPSTETIFAEVRQKNGNKYSRSGLTNIGASLQRHLTSPPFNRNINIIRDLEFQAANTVIQGQIKILRQSGNDITKHKKPIDSEDMAKIRESFKVETQAGLQNKVFLNLLLHFARRGQEGLRELTKTSLVIKKDSRGRKYDTMAYNEREQNHRGQNLKERDTEKLMFEHPGDASCPVASLEKYISKLNPRCDAFFQRPKTNFIADVGMIIWRSARTPSAIRWRWYPQKQNAL